MKKQQGFFIKIADVTYRGPFESLKQARNEARRYGKSINIYHGVLKRISDSIIDDTELYLVPRIKNE